MSVDESPDLCGHLLKLAHQYEVRGLVDQCSTALKGELEVGSAARLRQRRISIQSILRGKRSALYFFRDFSSRPTRSERAGRARQWPSRAAHKGPPPSLGAISAARARLVTAQVFCVVRTCMCE